MHILITYIHIDMFTYISPHEYFTTGLSAFGDLNKLFNSLRIVVASATRVRKFYRNYYYPFYFYSPFPSSPIILLMILYF